MGNISYIVTKTNIKPDRLRAVLEEVNREVFDGLLTMTEELEGEWGFGVVGVNDYCWGAYIRSPRKFGGKHPRGGGLVRYLWTRWQIEVAHRMKARIGDSCGIPCWDPEIGKYTTYLDYLRSWLVGKPNAAVRTFFAGRYNVECLTIPEVQNRDWIHTPYPTGGPQDRCR